MNRRKLLGIGGAALALWLGAGVARMFPLPPRIRALRGVDVAYFATPEQQILERGTADFEVIEEGLLVLRGGTIELYEKPEGKGWEGPLEAHSIAQGVAGVESFTVDRAGTVLFISGGELCQITAEGQKEPIVKLSHFRLGLAPGYEPGSVLLFGNDEGVGRGVVLRARAGRDEGDEGGVEPLATFDGRTRAVLDAEDGTYVALDAQIYQVVAERQRLVLGLRGALAKQAALGREPERITSLAMSEDGGMLFFATQDAVYALAGAMAVPVARDVGGALQLRQGILFVLDPLRELLVGLTGIREALAR